mmetsp:Transcript_19503/g.48877  ORF Transcript_19503/g.48877 Transcript_19503/m.48877 type:complete len:240 (+) Transcript_19503:1352-2071(+)
MIHNLAPPPRRIAKSRLDRLHKVAVVGRPARCFRGLPEARREGSAARVRGGGLPLARTGLGKLCRHCDLYQCPVWVRLVLPPLLHCLDSIENVRRHVPLSLQERHLQLFSRRDHISHHGIQVRRTPHEAGLAGLAQPRAQDHAVTKQPIKLSGSPQYASRHLSIVHPCLELEHLAALHPSPLARPGVAALDQRARHVEARGSGHTALSSLVGLWGVEVDIGGGDDIVFTNVLELEETRL